MLLRTVNIPHIVRRTLTIVAGVLYVWGAAHPKACAGQWPPVAEIAGRGGAAGAVEGVLSPLRPAQLPSTGTWRVRLDHHIPFRVPDVVTTGVRLGWTGIGLRAQPAWLTTVMATQFDAYSAMRVTVSHARSISGTGAHTIRLGASVGLDHETMGFLGARRSPILVVGGTWHPFSKLFTGVSVLNARASRLNGAVVRLDATWAEAVPWPRMHISLLMDPEFGLSVHFGSTWQAVEQVHLDVGGAGNPFRAAASVQVRTGAVRARIAVQWTPSLGTSRWISAGWSGEGAI